MLADLGAIWGGAMCVSRSLVLLAADHAERAPKKRGMKNTEIFLLFPRSPARLRVFSGKNEEGLQDRSGKNRRDQTPPYHS
jgi:hypothetical protein